METSPCNTSALEITGLLIEWSKGDRSALDKLLPLVEKELYRLAHYQIRNLRPGNTLQTTALINETFIRLIDQKRVQWKNRAHFFAISAQLMRRVLLNYIRDQKRLKRGGVAMQISFSEVMLITPQKTDELIALDEALDILAEIDERKSKVVELRFFGGMSVEETAEVLNVSPMTVIRDWNFAKAWLARGIRNEIE
ncbi:MAG: sigma-70 family RNA polymerase sigma factor [Pyrinomonadaceae bacterium]|nr:sigma-70 family RNA polymerase sigma factor [Pyrinomonadaceae bacterium]